LALLIGNNLTIEGNPPASIIIIINGTGNHYIIIVGCRLDRTHCETELMVVVHMYGWFLLSAWLAHS
jgi:hypothetical protein